LEDGNVQIIISDGQGRIINKLENVAKIAGEHSMSLDRLNIAKGVYFCTLSQNGNSKTKKMLVSK